MALLDSGRARVCVRQTHARALPGILKADHEPDDTYSRVFGRIDRADFEARVCRWIQRRLGPDTHRGLKPFHARLALSETAR